MEFPAANKTVLSVVPLNITVSSSKLGSSLGPYIILPHHGFILLLLIYILVIVFASLGSVLVITAVLSASHLRTHSNFYIVNLAVSDLLLVLVACPVTLVQVCTTYWPLPSMPILCKFASFLPLLFSFASTFSICVIALDRHQLIVHTSNPRHKTTITTISIISVWSIAVICAAPTLPNTKLTIITLSENIYQLLGIKERAYCMENWGYDQGR